METLLRQLAMLQLIPRQPRRIDTGTLRERLRARNFEVTLRTIQRDLNAMADVLPLVGDESKPQGWSWSSDAQIHQLPGLDPQTALVFRMAEEHLRGVLPASTLKMLNPWFKSARGVLSEVGKSLEQWPSKIRVLPRGVQLLPPKVDSSVQEIVYQGLLEERCVRLSYQSRDSIRTKELIIHPLALISRGPLSYLIVTLFNNEKPRLLLLHRIASAEILEVPAVRPPEFDLDQFIADGELGFRIGPPIRLCVEFSNDAVAILYETPLSDDQTIEIGNGDWIRVFATVPNTFELRGWLRGFGNKVRVIEPTTLLD